MAIRKLATAGAWWAQRADGLWLRWSASRSDWEPAPPPPGETSDPPAPPVFDFPVSTGTAHWELPGALAFLTDVLKTYLSLLLPSLLLLIVGYPFLLLLSLMFYWLGGPFDVERFVSEAGLFLSVYLAFLSLAIVMVRRSPITEWWGFLGWLGAAGAALLGSAAAGMLVGVEDPTLIAGLNRGALFALVTLSVFGVLERALKRLQGRLAPLRPRMFSA